MIRYILAAVLLCCSTVLFADELYFKDGSIMKGKVILEGKDTVEFSREGELKSYHFAKYHEVRKIVYDDGREVVFEKKNSPANAQNSTLNEGKNKYDAIVLKNGTILYGKILRVGANNIEYDPRGEIPFDVVDRENVQKIIYSSGKQVELANNASQENAPDQKKEEQAEPYTPTYRFTQAFCRIALIGAVGGFWGDLEDKEQDLYADNDTREPATSVEHNRAYGGLELDLMMHGSSMYYNFGLKGRWLGHSVFQNIYDRRDGDYTDDAEDLLLYNSVEAGPLFNLILNPKTRYIHLVLQTYFLYGRIYGGECYAEPILRDNHNVAMDRSEYYTSFDGYTLNGGIGCHLVINEGWPLTLGLNLNYTYSKLDFDDRLAVYDMKSTGFHSLAFELSCGVYF